MVYSDRSELSISNETIKISLSVKSYNKKTAENYQNCYDAEKCIVSTLSKISISNLNSTNWRLARVEPGVAWHTRSLTHGMGRDGLTLLFWFRCHAVVENSRSLRQNSFNNWSPHQITITKQHRLTLKKIDCK